ncbi:restriction endonuclease subunit S [Prochlorococcus marinus]|uniref:restriction endonuclease subunit S n=1 Tax=Prochlorococcus marinus TaxID=1219 RepID=UPI0019D390CA|nr:restriction endonuclease subunit S [Prochlorococcus marinus]
MTAKKISHLCKIIGSGTTPDKNDARNFTKGNIPWILSGDLNDGIIEKPNSYVTQYALDNNPSLKIYPRNSIIIAMYGATIGRVSIPKFSFTVNQACCVLSPFNKCELKYLFYCLIGLRHVLFSMAIGGAQPNINQELIKSLKILLPSNYEQKKIYKFLDQEIIKINLAIQNQYNLITLLDEKKQALVLDAITKGLDKEVSMKNSKLFLLGKIPNHWQSKKLSQLFKTSKGKNSQKLTKEYCSKNEGDYPVYSGQTQSDGIMAYINTFEFDAGEKGVILTTTVGAKAMSVKLIKGRFNLSQNCMVISAKDNSCHTAYFEYCFSSIFKIEKNKIPIHMQPSFRKEDFQKIRIPIPPIKEQIQISNFLHKEVEKIKQMNESSKLLISKLIDKRFALISFATSNQIDLS